jgi:hypothetical protein
MTSTHARYSVALKYILLLCICLTANAAVAQRLPLTWYISPTGDDELGNGTQNNPFETIQRGLDVTIANDTVQVSPGVYYENIEVYQNVYLRGSGHTVTTIIANGVVIDGADGATVEGFTVQKDEGSENSWGYAGAYSTTLKNNVFEGHYVGIHCGQTGGDLTIFNNVLIDNQRGILFGWDAEPDIRNNIIFGTGAGMHWYDDSQDTYETPSATIAYNNVWTSGTSYDFTPVPGTGNISADPKFGDTSVDDYGLLAGSPCIDAGDPDDLYYDIDGSRNDMGVYGGPCGEIYSGPVPVELATFQGRFAANSVQLLWTTVSESENYGFDIERAVDGINFKKIGFVKGHGTSTTLHRYAFSDNHIMASVYQYRLKQIDTDGNFDYSSILTVQKQLPEKFELLQNFPNPFNPETTIAFNLPETGHVRLLIYNSLGEVIKTLIDEQKTGGYHQVNWNGTDDNGLAVASGVYMYKIAAASFSTIKKAILIR